MGERCAPEKDSSSGAHHRNLDSCERPHGRHPPHRGSTRLEFVIVIVFATLFAWISIGFWEAMAGLFTLARRVDRFSITLGVEEGQSLEGTGARTAILIPQPMRNRSGCLPVSRRPISLWRAQARSGTSISLSSVTQATLTGGRRGDDLGGDLPLPWGFQPDFLSKKKGEPQAQERKHRRLLQAVGQELPLHDCLRCRQRHGRKYLGSDGSGHGAAPQSRDSPDGTSCREP